MCLIIASQDGKKPSDSILHDGFYSNPHGYGMVYLDKGSLVTRKGFDYKDFTKDFAEVKSPYVLHFRWATHGLKNLENCHPFKVRKGLYMAHNGILQVPIIDESRSDTYNFVKHILTPQVNSFNGSLHGKGLLPAIEYFIGRFNKLAFLDSKGEITLVNEKEGTWYEGMWFSNESSLPNHQYDKWLTRYSPKRKRRKGDITEDDFRAAWADGEDAYTELWEEMMAENEKLGLKDDDTPEVPSLDIPGTLVKFADMQQCDYCSEELHYLYELKDDRHNAYLCAACNSYWSAEERRELTVA